MDANYYKNKHKNEVDHFANQISAGLAFTFRLVLVHLRVALFSFGLLFFNFQISAQQLPFAHLSISDGLEDTVVFSIEQDDLGFLWIATRTGINRFDGERFWTYGQNDGLPHNLARDLHKSKDGTLWVASERGVAWFDGSSFHALEEKDGWPEKVSARALAEATDGSLWVATYGAGLLHIKTDGEPKVIEQFNRDSGLPSDRIRSLLIDKQDNIWLGMSDQVVRLTDGKPETITWQAKSTEIRALYQHTDGNIWAGTRHGIAHFVDNAFIAMDLGTDLSKQTINTITRDKKGNVWLGTRDFGVYQFDPHLQVKHLDMLDGLPDNSVNSIFQDSEDNLWFGTYGGGIARLSTSKVLNWKAQPGLPNPNVYAIADDHNGCIWFGTNGNGVSSLCEDKMTHMTRSDGLPHNKILSTMIDSHGNPWFGTLQGISQLNQGQFINYDQKDGLSGSVSYHIMQASDDSFWIGTNNGLNQFDGHKFTQYRKSHGLPDDRINRILESNDGDLWLASANGLTHYHEGEFSSWSTDDGLPANFINDFYEDQLGGLWIATNNGLSYFSNGQFRNWDTTDGLPHNNCTVILPGKDNEIWIGTSRGVAIFDGEDFTVITSKEGLVFDLVNRGAGYRDPQGNLWFGTGDGISRFATDFKPGASNQPPVHLLSVSNNQQQLTLNDSAQIQQQDSSLRFNYSAISFQRAPDVNYRYRLNSGNTPWRETRLRELQINSLAAGDYTFEVTARVGKGEWNQQPATFNFTVTPPFWRTTWFVVLLITSLLFALLLRSYRSRQHAIQLENLVQERTKQLEEVNQGLEWLANHDNLTRLANRNQIQQTLSQLDINLELGVIVIDLDYFKSINDQYGHLAGDKALQAFANMLLSLTREGQQASRWGGEEFLIICPKISSSRLSALAEQILQHCRQLDIVFSDDLSFGLKCSIGFAMTPPQQQNKSLWEKTIQLADMALYDAKHDGRDCAIGYLWQEALPNDWDFNRVIMEKELALKQNILARVKI